MLIRLQKSNISFLLFKMRVSPLFQRFTLFLGHELNIHSVRVVKKPLISRRAIPYSNPGK